MGRTVYAASKCPVRIVLDVVLLLSCSLSLVGCALTSKGSSPAANPSISITPSLVSFGDVRVKTQTSETIKLSNTSTTDLVISQATISGTGFSISGLTVPMTLPAGMSINFAVFFKPTTTGTSSATISITSNASSSPVTVNLTGAGVIASNPSISVTPTAVSFGNQTVKTLASQTVTLSNTGSADLAISQASVTGAGYSMSGLNAPMTVAAGASANFTVSFQPIATGVASGSISIVSDASPSPLTVSLTGTGVAAATPAINVTPGAVSFGNQTVKTSASQSVTVSNTGTAALSISQASVSGTGYSMAGLAAPVTVAAGASTSFTVTFQPAAAGAASGSVTITSNSSNSPSLSIPLSGTGVAATAPVISVSPSAVAFGNQTVKTSTSQTVMLSNTGTAALSISQASASGAGFSMTGLAAPVTVAAGASTSFTVTFQPAAAGAATGNVTITSNASNSPSLSIPLSGTGVASILTLSASPSSVAFGSVTVATAATQNVQLTNTGNAEVDITTVSTSGTGFSVTGGSNTILNPNQSVTVTVSFTPQTAAQLSGNLAVSSNAAALNVPLSGTGVAAPNHSVSLAWDASPSTDVVSYNLYRSTSSTGTFTKVGSTTTTTLVFTDTMVQGGQTYFYEVTSVGSGGLESAVDGPIQVAVPSP